MTEEKQAARHSAIAANIALCYDETGWRLCAESDDFGWMLLK